MEIHAKQLKIINMYRRYYESLENLNKIIEVCDEVNIYDNTDRFKEIIYFKDGKLIWQDKVIPNWSSNIIYK